MNLKHCVITPTKFINDPLFKENDFLLVLSHLLDTECSNEYAVECKKFRKTGKKLYLDNGLFENNKPESGMTLLNKAKKMDAELIFAPDHLFDFKKTEEAFEEFADLRDKEGFDIKLVMVIQANNAKDYIETYKKAEANKRVDMIAISILSAAHSFKELTGTDDITINRIKALEEIDKLNPKKPVHMLGLGGALDDLVAAKKYKWVKSNDSCSAFMTGLKGKKYKKLKVEGGKIKEKVTFEMNGKLNKEQVECITHNIKTINSIK